MNRTPVPELTCRESLFGHLDDGTPVHKYVLGNRHGMQASVLTYGGILQALLVPDRNGHYEDVVLGFDDLAGYQRHHRLYLGALIGRYANRLAGGRFELSGRLYQVPLNDGANALHGGPDGFDKKVWEAQPVQGSDWVGVRLSCLSADGEMGFPGNLRTEVTYSLDNDNQLRVEYQAVSDAPTALNLTQHAYFNLAGAGNGDILSQVATLHASRYLPVTEQLIPSGEMAPVAGTPMDFRQATPIGRYITDDHPQLRVSGVAQQGFNHHWMLDAGGDLSRLAVEIHDPQSGRRLQLHTTEPGVQFYTSNAFDGSAQGKAGKPYPRWAGFALEAQNCPDGINQPGFPRAWLEAGEVYRQTTLIRFSAQ